MGRPQIFETARFVQLLTARVAALHQLRAGQQFECLALGQCIFEGRRRHIQLQSFLAGLEIEQRIAQRQIE